MPAAREPPPPPRLSRSFADWSLLALLAAEAEPAEACQRAARFLMDRQRDEGDWPREAMTWIFNKTAVINYENYRRYFCVWALSELDRRLTEHEVPQVREGEAPAEPWSFPSLCGSAGASPSLGSPPHCPVVTNRQVSQF